MKILFLLICCCGMYHQMLAQESYHISYEFGIMKRVDGQLIKQPKDGYVNLVFNDSICYNYYSPTMPRLKDNQAFYGKRFVNHGYMFHVPSKLMFTHHAGTLTATQLPDSMYMKPWIFYDNANESFLANDCQSAYRVVGINDTLTTTYSKSIPYSFGPQYPFYTPGIPGALLVYYNVGTSFYYQAVRIVKGNFVLVKPKNYVLEFLSH